MYISIYIRVQRFSYRYYPLAFMTSVSPSRQIHTVHISPVKVLFRPALRQLCFDHSFILILDEFY